MEIPRRNGMKNAIRIAIVGVVLLASRGAVLAQHEGHEMGQATANGECLAQAKESLRIVESASLRLEEARQTNSPQRMRAAMDDLQAALAEVRTQLTLCVKPATKTGPGAGNSSPQAPAGKAIDPVCGTEVNPASAPKATWEGKTYFFCSEADKAKFEKNPKSFVKP